MIQNTEDKDEQQRFSSIPAKVLPSGQSKIRNQRERTTLKSTSKKLTLPQEVSPNIDVKFRH